MRAKSRMFFLEIILCLGIFLLCAGTCLNLFTQASNLTQKSYDLSGALTLSQSIAEQLRSENGDFTSIQAEYLMEKHGDEYIGFLNANWHLLPSEEDAHYRISCTVKEDSALSSLCVTVFSLTQDCVIYTLQTSFFAQEVYTN